MRPAASRSDSISSCLANRSPTATSRRGWGWLSFRYFALRKLHFLLRARAMVAFPGGYGTFDELFETLTLVQCRKMAPIPIVLVGRAWWRRAVGFDFLTAEGVISRRDARLFRFADTAAEIWDAVRRPALRARRSPLPS
jgi:uncharacterized protein (TIGR00730 family)